MQEIKEEDEQKNRIQTLFENIQDKRRDEKINNDPKYENFNEDLGIDKLIDEKFIELDKPLKHIKEKYYSIGQ